MPITAPRPTEQPADAALILYACLRDLAGLHSNAVLQVLGDRPRIVEGHQYPRPSLAFAGGRWRAYYHSHRLPSGTAQEHGHFHLFFVTDGSDKERAWIHVAGLAMDQEGQPLRWFASNRWVTAGDWGARAMILAAIDALRPADEERLIARWLSAMLCLYRCRLADLLDTRDERLRRAMRVRRQGLEQVLADRALYELAECDVDLAPSLQALLANGAPP